MVKLLSLPIAAPSILIVLFGGLGIVGTGLISNVWAYAIWGIGFIWFAGVLCYLRQKIDIDIHECAIKTDSDTSYIHISVKGFISSRHADGLINLKLLLYPDVLNDSSSGSKIPHSINSNPQLFIADYEFGFDLLGQGREGQERGKAIDIAWLCAQMRNGHWLSVVFRIPMAREIRERRLFGLQVIGQLSSKARRKTGRMEISEEEYDKLIRVAKPVEKKV